MQTRLDKKMAKFATRFNNVAWLKSLLKPFYNKYKLYRKNHRTKLLQRNGMGMLSDFHRIMTDNNISYSIAYGTLLGAIRDKGFIKHDCDIDVWMWKDDYSPKVEKLLSDIGFKLMYSFQVDGGLSGLEHTYIRNGVTFDIFFLMYDENNKVYCCDFLLPPGIASYEDAVKSNVGAQTRRLWLPITKERKQIKFGKLNLFAPINSTEILRQVYGPGFMTPNPNWTMPKEDENSKIWNGKNAIVKFNGEI